MKKQIRRTLVALSCAVGLFASLGAAACTFSGDCDHQWDGGVVQVAETCTTDGTKLYTCSKCKETRTEKIAAAHKYELGNETTATCQHGGSATYVCKVCGDSYEKGVTGVLPCSYEVTTSEVTCTADGTETHVCKWCGDTYVQITKRATGHDTKDCKWEFVEDVQKNGCEYERTETTNCKTCGLAVTHTETVYKHEYNAEITKTATCVAKGEITYTCGGCEASYTIRTEADANAHAWTATGTDSSTGITSYVCNHNTAHTKTTFSAKDKVEATIPANALSAGEIELQNAAIAMDEKVRDQLGGKDVDLSVKTVDEAQKEELTSGMTEAQLEQLGNSPIYDFKMMQASEAVTQFNGKLTVTVPYTLAAGEDPANIAVWYIGDDGKPTPIAATYSVSGKQGYATFETDHFSCYTVVRLSAEERCTLYGHDWIETTVAATCDKDGYTLVQCRKCHESNRKNFVGATGHSYKSEVKAPSCSAKGYTTYICENCGDKYLSDYTAKTEHNYQKTVKAPTCTADGYTLNVCEDCGISYTSDTVKASGHKYANGTCSVCGKDDPELKGMNFYFNMIDSLVSAETYCLEVTDFQMKNIWVSSDGTSDESVFTLESAKFMLGLDGDRIYGKGTGIVSGKVTEYKKDGTVKSVENQSMAAKFVLRDGFMYMSVVDSTGEQSMWQIAETDVMFEGMPGSGMTQTIAGMLQLLDTEKLGELVAGISAQGDNPLNSVLAAVMEYVCNKTETANGYAFTLNFARILDVYDALKENTVEGLVNLVFGADAYNNVVNYLTAAVDKTAGDLLTDVTGALAACGVEVETVYDIINGFVNGMNGVTDETAENKFDVRAVLEQYKTVPVVDLLNGMTGGEATADDYKAMINQYAAQIKEIKLLDMIMGSMGGGSESGKPSENPDAVKFTADAEDAADGEDAAKDPVRAQLQAVVEMLGDTEIVLTTDKTGNVLSLRALWDGFEHATREELLEEIKKENTDGWGSSSSSNQYLEKLGLKLVVNGTFAGEYEDVVKECETLLGATQFKQSIKLEYGETIVVDKKDGETYLISNSLFYNAELISSAEDTYCDVKCTKEELYVNDPWGLAIPGKTQISAQNDCYGWKQCYVSWQDIYNVKVTLWTDENKEILGVEIDEDGGYEEGYMTSCRVYYNPTTGEFAANTQHAYKLVEHKDPVACEKEEGYDRYACTVCGASKKEFIYEGHVYAQRYELAEGSESCEDGVWDIGYCEICDEILYKHLTNDHETFEHREKVGTAVCGDVFCEWRACACGEESYNYEIVGKCCFDDLGREWIYDDKNDHWIDTYRCAVNECAYTYTVESYVVYNRNDCTATRYYVYKMGVNGDSCEKQWTRTDTWESHNTELQTTNNADGSVTYKWTCSVCLKVTTWYTEKYDEYGRETYYENHLTGYKRTTVWKGCAYTSTETYADGESYPNSGVEHRYEKFDGQKTSCTQPVVYGYYCRVCGEGDKQVDDPRGHNYYKDYVYDENGCEIVRYICRDCGMESETGADGPVVIENMSEGENIVFGYWDTTKTSVEIYVVVDYGTESDNRLEGDLYTVEVNPDYKACGIVTLDVQAVGAALEGIEGSTLSVVFQCFDEFSGTYLDSVFTFDLSA